VSRLSKKCESLDVSQIYVSPRPVTGIIKKNDPIGIETFANINYFFLSFFTIDICYSFYFVKPYDKNESIC
jgi:hypothetical protein